VVTAAGNKGINPTTGNPGYGGVGVPCNAPSAICVGSIDTKGTPDTEDDVDQFIEVVKAAGRSTIGDFCEDALRFTVPQG
jgi:hypothetical protein